MRNKACSQAHAPVGSAVPPVARGFKLVPCRLTLPDGRRVFGCKWVKEG